MKFCDGFWMIPENMEITNAMHIWDVKAFEDKVIFYIMPKLIEDRGQQLNSPLITLTLTGAAEGVLGLRYEHFCGKIKNEPSFALNKSAPMALQTEITDEKIVITHGDMHFEAMRYPFTFTVTYKGKLLTKSHFKDVGYAEVKDKNKNYIYQRLGLDIGELTYGLGERFSPFVKNGQAIDIWNEDGGTSTMQAYKNIPFYITNKSYGVFVNHPENVSFEMASEHVSKTQFSVGGENLEYFIIAGENPKEVITRYGHLTGLPALPPPWSFGLWLTTSFTTNYDENTINEFVDGMSARNIPLHVFHFDCFWMKGLHWCNFEWDETVFPDPKGMLKRLKEKDLKICAWINPYIAQLSHLFEEGKNQDYFLKKDENTVWQWDKWQAGQAIVDFTNPKACEWYKDNLRKLIKQGVDCFKTDFGERIPVDVLYHDGSNPHKMHNYYSYLYNKVVFDLLKEEKGEGEAVLFARSATVGGQQFPVHWGGDCDATYEAMAETLRGGLSLGLAGFGFWSHDIGGFESTAPAHLYKRWCAFGLFSSHSRLHGSKSYRVPWLYDDEAVDVLRYFTQLKCKLMPYLYHQAQQASQTGVPMLRPMMLEFIEDKNTHHLDCQYMLGGNLLVAPIFNKEGDVEVYLPKEEGLWTHFLSNEQKQAGCWHKEQYDFMSLPLYVRPNSLMILGASETKVDYEYHHNFEAHLFELADGKSAFAEINAARGGKTIAKINIQKQGQQIICQTQGKVGDWALILRHIFEVKSVSCGETKMVKQGLKIKLKAGDTKVIINL